jgi:hypothetical protein
MRKILLLLVVPAILNAAAYCSGTTLYDNLANGTGTNGDTLFTRIRGIAFNTDAASYNSLTATLPLSANPVQGPAILRLFSSSPGATVGSQLATFTSPATFSQFNVQPATFTLSGVTLSPNTLYWLLLNHTGSGSINWAFSSTGIGSGVGFTNFEAFSDDNGATWQYHNGAPNLAKIEATVVPEPSTSALLAIGGIVIVGVAKRRLSRSGFELNDSATQIA